MANHPPIVKDITKSVAVDVIARLSAQFDVKPPEFRFNKTRGRGLYYPVTQTVTIARPHHYGTWRMGEHSLLHEFAHHLADLRVMNALGTWKFKDLPHHDDRFKRALLDVVTFYYGDPAHYAWNQEYKNVMAWARQRGLLEPKKPSVIDTIMSLRLLSTPTSQPTLGLGAFVVAERPVTRHGEFNREEAVRLWKSGMRMTDIVEAVHGTRAKGHTGNLVRQTLREAGLIPAKETR